MADASNNGVRGRYEVLAARLEEADSSTDRAALKADIIELFRAVEREISDLTALKEDIKKLVERWKALGGATDSGVPHPAAQPSAPVREDHIETMRPVLRALGR